MSISIPLASRLPPADRFTEIKTVLDPEVTMGEKVWDKPASPTLRLVPIHGRSLASRLRSTWPRRELSGCSCAEARVKQLYSKKLRAETICMVSKVKACSSCVSFAKFRNTFPFWNVCQVGLPVNTFVGYRRCVMRFHRIMRTWRIYC